MNPTKSEKKYHDKLVEVIGCIICRNEYATYNNQVSIHHIIGRTKKGCHMNVLPLCFPHHQGHRGLHNPAFGKRTWVKLFGNEKDLKEQCDGILNEQITKK